MRGMAASVGVGTENASLHEKGKVPLAGFNGQSWGICLRVKRSFHKNKMIKKYPLSQVTTSLLVVVLVVVVLLVSLLLLLLLLFYYSVVVVWLVGWFAVQRRCVSTAIDRLTRFDGLPC